MFAVIATSASTLDKQMLITLGATAAAGVIGGLFWLKTKRSPKKYLDDGIQRPPHLTSWIPYLGSAMKLISGSTIDFVVGTSKKLQSGVFTATIAGTKCVFISDPDLVFVVFKDSVKEIDSLSLQKRAMVKIAGVPSSNIDAIFSDKERSKQTLGQIHRYFLQPEYLRRTLENVQIVIDDNLKLIQQASFSSMANDGWVEYDMFAWVRKIIFYASIGPIVSTELTKHSVVEDYTKFEEGLGLLFSDAPSFVTRENVAARERLVKLLMQSNVAEGFSDFMKAREEVIGDRKELFARANLGLFIATVSNSIPSVFWVLFHVLSNAAAYEACKEEVKSVASKRTQKFFSLEDLDQMTIIQGCFMEALRMYQSFFATRDVIDDFILNPKSKSGPKYLIEQGSRIMAYPATVHNDPEIFERPDVFKYDRFVDPSAKAKNGKLLNTQLRPFGGGAHLCPGRKFISYELRSLLAEMILRFDMKLTEPDRRPGIQLKRQGFSVANPDFDPKLMVRIKQESAQ